MSENKKVVLGTRKTKDFTLPESGAIVTIYATIIAKDLGGLDVSKIQDKESNNIEEAVNLLTGLIKSWNIYESDEAEKPREINTASVGDLPIKDLMFLFEKLKDFIDSEKKD